MPHLITALNDKDPDVAFAAACALGNFGSDAAPAVPALARAAKAAQAHVRSGVFCALARLAPLDPAAAAVLVDAASDPTLALPLRIDAIRAIGNAGSCAKGAIPSLLDILHEEKRDLLASTSSLRALTAWALGQMGTKGKPAIPMLLRDLRNRTLDLSIRRNGVEALGNIGIPEKGVITVLVDALMDKDTVLSVRAAEALEKFGPASKPAVPLLQSLEADLNQPPFARLLAARVLDKIAK